MISNVPFGIKLHKREEIPNRCVFHIKGLHTSLVNGIRRELMASVHSVAMVAEPVENSTIHIHSNTSRLNNQFLALRLSLIPVNLPPPHEGHVEYGTNVFNRYEIRIDVTATEPGIRNVTTDDIEIYDKDTGSFLKRDIVKRIFPRDPNPACNQPIQIVPLRGPNGDRPGEEVKVRASLALNVGSVHNCFSPVCCATYQFKIDEAVANEALEKAIDEKGVRGTEREEGFRQAFMMTDAQRYIEKDDNGDPVGYQFVIESITDRDPVELFHDACMALYKRFVNVRKEINMLYKQQTQVESKGSASANRVDIVMDGDEYLFSFKNENHTLGTILQDQLLRDAFVKDNERIRDWFVGYRIPHPLTPEMVMKVHRKHLSFNELFEGYMIPALETLEETVVRVASSVRKDIVSHPLQSFVDGLTSSTSSSEIESSSPMVSTAAAAAAAGSSF